MVASSMTVSASDSDLLAQLPGEERRVPVNGRPFTASNKSPSSDRAVRGSKITGAFWVATLRGFSRRSARSAARRPTCFRALKPPRLARRRVPVIALHATVRSCATGTTLRPQLTGAVASRETARIGEHARADVRNRTPRPPNSRCADRRQSAISSAVPRLLDLPIRFHSPIASS